MSRINKPIVGDDGELLVAHPVPPLPTTPEWVPEPSEPPPAPPSPPAAPQRRWIELSVWQLGVMILLIGGITWAWLHLRASLVSPGASHVPSISSPTIDHIAMQIMDRPPLVLNVPSCTSTDFNSAETQMVMATEPRPGEPNLYLLTHNATQACRVANFTEVQSPRWSPDGGAIIFATNVGMGRQLSMFPASNLTEGNLQDILVAEGPPNWSSVTQLFAILGGTIGRTNNEIFLGESEDAPYSQAVFGTFALDNPVWMPDGDAIAFLLNTTLGKGVVLRPLHGQAYAITGVIPGIVSFDWR